MANQSNPQGKKDPICHLLFVICHFIRAYARMTDARLSTLTAHGPPEQPRLTNPELRAGVRNSAIVPPLDSSTHSGKKLEVR